jgi:hypothetical protein
MQNITANEIVGLIKKSTYVLTDEELNTLELIENLLNEGADLEAEESLQLENLFEKIKRGGFLK